MKSATARQARRDSPRLRSPVAPRCLRCAARPVRLAARPSMASSSPIPAAAEDRVLAAIVFTDVVGFSARMQTKESDTLKLLEKDFSAMRDLGTTLSGSVIKTTGDGLLLFFKIGRASCRERLYISEVSV